MPPGLCTSTMSGPRLLVPGREPSGAAVHRHQLEVHGAPGLCAECPMGEGDDHALQARVLPCEPPGGVPSLVALEPRGAHAESRSGRLAPCRRGGNLHVRVVADPADLPGLLVAADENVVAL